MDKLADLIGTADSATAVLVASYLIFQLVRTAWRRTVGSRRIYSKKILGLAVGNPLAHVESLFGTAILTEKHDAADAYEDRVDAEWRLYDARHGWLTAHYADQELTGFSFTRTDNRFLLDVSRLTYGQLVGRLGSSRFSDLQPARPDDFSAALGASTVSYAEQWYGARPGLYHYFGVGQVSLGVGRVDNGIGHVGRVAQGLYSEGGVGLEVEPSEVQLSALDRYRRTAIPNTIFIISSDAPKISDLFARINYCFHEDSMARIRGNGPIGWQRLLGQP